MHVWNFAPVWANADLLALGLLNTLKVTGAALAFGVPLGLVLALMRLSPRRLLSWPASAVIEVFRTTPPLTYFPVTCAASQLVHGLERRLATSGEGMAR